MALSLPILDTLIKNQEDAIRQHTLHSYVIVLIGITIIIGTNFFIENNNEMLKNLLNIGGGLVSTLSAYPINQIISRKEKARTYEMFKQNIDNMSTEESKKFEDMIWATLNKI